MKHTVKVTLILVMLFLLTQVVGLATVNKYLQVEKTADGKIIIKHQDTVLGPQPKIKESEKLYSAIGIIILVLIGTGLVFLLIRFRLGRFWKYWFFFAIWMTLAITFNIYIQQATIALLVALILAFIKAFRPNIFFHNFTEIFIYSGITIIILPYLNIISAVILLLLISAYDMFAVWKSKHMIKLAKFQTKSKLFAGLIINYGLPEAKQKPLKKTVIAEKQKTAILGGGDMAFPLIFSAAAMESLIKFNQLPKQIALLETFIISLCVTIALAILFMLGKKDKFYPAMPFLSAGCFVGYGVVMLVNII